MINRLFFKNPLFFFKVIKKPWVFNFYNKNILILEVFKFSNKIDIKNSVEFIYGVKVKKVNTLIKKIFFYKNNNLLKIQFKKKAYIFFL